MLLLLLTEETQMAHEGLHRVPSDYDFPPLDPTVKTSMYVVIYCHKQLDIVVPDIMVLSFMLYVICQIDTIKTHFVDMYLAPDYAAKFVLCLTLVMYLE